MGSSNDKHQEGGHHIVPFKILMNVCLALLALTVFTVVAARLQMGPIAAFGIAAVKAYLVMAYFMGLKYDAKLNRLIFATGFLGLALLFAFSFGDIITRILQTSTL